MIRIISTCLLFTFFACSSEQSAIALNWFARIDHAPGCGGSRNAALIAGKDTLVCPLDRAYFNGDSIALRSEGKCYFINLQRITEYKSKADLEEINCEGLADFIGFNASEWPKQGIYDQRVE